MVCDVPFADDKMITLVGPDSERKREERCAVILSEPNVVIELAEHWLERRSVRLWDRVLRHFESPAGGREHEFSLSRQGSPIESVAMGYLNIVWRSLLNLSLVPDHIRAAAGRLRRRRRLGLFDKRAILRGHFQVDAPDSGGSGLVGQRPLSSLAAPIIFCRVN